jgi:tight adherence protein B
MILSSCLKGGLSLLQAIETMVDEMPAPISQEFAMIIKENKMGVALEESLTRLTKRMPSEDLNLMNTAILVARETGGNLPEVFSRLVGTIRSKVNVNETVRTMTVMGRAQGILLSILPFVFVIFIYNTNPTMMQDMIKTEQGRIMLGIAAVLQTIGIVLIKIFSRVEV